MAHGLLVAMLSVFVIAWPSIAHALLTSAEHDSIKALYQAGDEATEAIRMIVRGADGLPTRNTPGMRAAANAIIAGQEFLYEASAWLLDIWPGSPWGSADHAVFLRQTTRAQKVLTAAALLATARTEWQTARDLLMAEPGGPPDTAIMRLDDAMALLALVDTTRSYDDPNPTPYPLYWGSSHGDYEYGQWSAWRAIVNAYQAAHAGVAWWAEAAMHPVALAPATWGNIEAAKWTARSMALSADISIYPEQVGWSIHKRAPAALKMLLRDVPYFFRQSEENAARTARGENGCSQNCEDLLRNNSQGWEKSDAAVWRSVCGYDGIGVIEEKCQTPLVP